MGFSFFLFSFLVVVGMNGRETVLFLLKLESGPVGKLALLIVVYKTEQRLSNAESSMYVWEGERRQILEKECRKDS